MVPDDYDGFDYFVRERQSDLKRIAGNTRGEYQLADVTSEAWIMAQEMHSTKNIPIRFSDPEYQERLLSYLYQALVRYTDTNVRYASMTILRLTWSRYPQSRPRRMLITNSPNAMPF